jgi:D-arabinose 1-dehydrogenase-like Zn-dependent alcohol dehydrogenase
MQPIEEATDMRTAVVRAFGEPLVIEDRPVPEPGERQVRVKIETSGVCHTDIHAANGDWPVKPALPLVPGHEGVGIVDELGPGVTRVSVGQRVAIPWLGGADGTCEYCVKGRETYCVAPTFTGYTVDGGYREYSIANADFVALVPREVDALDAAPLTCAGVTTYKAVKEARIGPSDVVGFVGVGGLGHLGVQYAAKMGFEVVAIARGTDKEPLARELGAHHYVDSTASDVAKELTKLGGAKVVLATVTVPDAMTPALGGLKPGGQLVVVGASADPMQVPPFALIAGSTAVQGHASGTSQDSEDTLRFSALTGVRPRIETMPLDEAQAAYDKMMSGDARFRMVLTMS